VLVVDELALKVRAIETLSKLVVYGLFFRFSVRVYDLEDSGG
jgi:hypothetical protein